MAKYATSSALRSPRVVKAKSVPVTNLAGGPGFSQSHELEFASILLTNFMKDDFYRTETGTVLKLRELLDKVDPSFAAKAAIYARDKFGMRSVSHFVAAELAKRVKGTSWLRRFFEKVVIRPDDTIEILACYLASYQKPIPNSLKRGLGAALAKFNDYQIAKYRREGQPFKLVDVVNLVRPPATPALTALVKGKLKPAETWETQLTQAGQQDAAEVDIAEAKAEVWRQLLAEKKLGYLALIRNLRNILQSDTRDDIRGELSLQLCNPEAIKRSRVFPFQISKAYDELKKASGDLRAGMVLSALSHAVDIACDNVPVFEGRTCVILDISGSMSSNDVDRIAAVFAAVMVKAWKADLVVFSDRAAYRSLNPGDSTLTLAEQIRFATGGTNLPAVFTALHSSYARLVILSDMQTWLAGPSSLGYVGSPVQPFADYCRRFSVKPTVFSFDLKNYGAMAFPQEKVFCMAGFSPQVFDLMARLELDRNALVNEIKAVEVM